MAVFAPFGNDPRKPQTLPTHLTILLFHRPSGAKLEFSRQGGWPGRRAEKHSASPGSRPGGWTRNRCGDRRPGKPPNTPGLRL